MEKQAGVILTNVWDTLKGKQKVQILDQIVDIERCLAATKFSQFGSLYYKGDLPDNSDTSPLYVDSTGDEVRSKTFDIGPTNHSQNIFVDPEDPSRIVGIIDWQSVNACPLFMQVGRPAFLDYNGPVPEDLGKVPLPPNFDS
jgi:hypothetical protein